MKTLLIADEDQRIKNIVRFTFERMGYKVVSTASGADAVSKARGIKPDIILVDVSLSDKSGYEVSKEIKNDPLLENTTVILLASIFAILDEAKATEALADGFMRKPFEFKEIVKKVESFGRQNKNKKPYIRPDIKTKTTFVKVITVILVIFALIASALYHYRGDVKPSGINLSEGELKPMPVEAGKKITITVNGKGEIFIGNKKYSISELKTYVPTLISSLGSKIEDGEISLKADASVPYGIVMEVASELKRAGVKKLDFAAEPVLLSGLEQNPDLGEISREEKIKASESKETGVTKEVKKTKLEKEEPLNLKEEKPRVIYAIVLENEKRKNGELAAQKPKPTQLSKVSPVKEAKEKETEPKKVARRVPEETKKVEEKEVSKKENTKASQPERKEAPTESKKVQARKEIPEPKETSKTKPEGTKYVAKKGDSLWSIAKKFDTTVKDIKAANELESNRIRAGAVLVIPQKMIVKSNSSEKKKETPELKETPGTKPEETKYVVKKGDSFIRIAKKFDTTVKDIKVANELESDKIRVGTALVIPQVKEKVQVKKEIPKPEKISEGKPEGAKYVVRKGDNLTKIARKFDTTVKDIKAANELKSDKIRVGGVLIVPQVKERVAVKENSKRKVYRGYLTDIKITDWSLYVAWGVPTLHHVTIENTSDVTYKDVKIRANYYSNDHGRGETGKVEGILPVTIPPRSKATYFKNGLTLKQGSAANMYGEAISIEVIGATPIIKEDSNLLSSR